MRRTPASLRPWRSSIRARIVIACAILFLVPGAILTGIAYTQIGHVLVIQSGPQGEVSSRQGNETYFNDANNPQISATRDDSKQRGFLEFALAGLGLGTLLAGGLGWAVSRRVLRPLAAVTTAAQAASQENLDQRPAASATHLKPVLAAIGAAVDKSEELIEALLTLARSDRGPGPAELVDLPTAVEDAIDLIGPAAAARQIQIRTALQDAQVTGDRVLLERLVSNLIENAVRHNVTGGWVLASTRTRSGIAEITVSNGGEHIPPDQTPELFEPFRRLSGRTGNQPGSGLGLSIVASVARAHSGHAEAHARPDGGLDIQITLPATANGRKDAPPLPWSPGGAIRPPPIPPQQARATRPQDERSTYPSRPRRAMGLIICRSRGR
jgi:signal transduction histidine kinase